MALFMRNYFIAAVIFLFLFTGVYEVANTIRTGGVDSSTAVPDFIGETELNTYNRTFGSNGLQENITSFNNQINNLNVEIEAGDTSLSIAFIKRSWSVIKNIIGSFTFMNESLRGATGFLHIPAFAVNLIITIIGVLVIFSVISLIFGKDT